VYRIIAVFLISLIGLSPFAAQAMEYGKPQMREDEFYKEYWQQHLLFEDGTFLTSQFLVANFPWPVGKDHGIMVATLVTPDGERKIIKNGRNPGEWGFDPEKFDIFIHNHRLKSDGGRHQILLRADDGSEVTVAGASDLAPLVHPRFERDGGFMESSFYLPFFTGEGNWRIMPDEEGNAVRSGAGQARGFATHVILNSRLPDMMESWLRVSGLQKADDQAAPFLSSIQRPDGKKDILLSLRKGDGQVAKFSDVRLKFRDMQKEDKKSSFPRTIEVAARNDTAAVQQESLTGTIRLVRKIDHFNINDHLNFFEKGFAQSRASVANYRYVAEYDLTYATPEGRFQLKGEALSEYADILPPKESKKKKRRRR